MNRKEVIKVATDVNNGILNKEDISVFLISYCIERGKPHELSTLFITYLFSNPLLLSTCLYEALEYYYRELNICLLYFKENKKNCILIY